MDTAVVTGAGRGLGRLIAQGLAEKGYSVLVTDIDELGAAETARRIGQHAWSMHQDVRDPESHRQVARAAHERGPLAVWVNNAGVLHTGTTWELGEDEIRRQFDVNVLGVIWGSRAAVDVMERGHIINIASMAALVPSPGLSVYCATKHAVLGFSLAMQGDLERAGRPIVVSSVCPDAIDTDMVRDVADRPSADILFSANQLLSPEYVATRTVNLVDSRKLVAILPRYRGMLAHMLRPFPSLSLKLLERFRQIGERHREQKH